MKKIVKASLLASAIAKTMSAQDINNLVIYDGQPDNLYIYGRYVYDNTISSADLQDAMDDLLSSPDYGVAYRSIFSDGKAALIHKSSKNEWSVLKDNSSLKTNYKSFDFEMTHLIGDVDSQDDHIAASDSVYDGTYVKDETHPDGRKIEVFVDEMADLSIADIKATDGKGDLGNTISNDTHAYNTKALSVSFKNDVLTLTENSPLLTYNNGTTTANWVGLIIKTNKPLEKTDKILFICF